MWERSPTFIEMSPIYTKLHFKSTCIVLTAVRFFHHKGKKTKQILKICPLKRVIRASSLVNTTP